MELMQVISGRRSVRKYQTKPVEESKLQRVLESARLAPSARNRQPYRIIVVRDPDVKKKVAEAANNQQMLLDAPVVLVACGEDGTVMSNEQNVDTINVSIAMSFAILAAYEQGLSTCWLASYSADAMRKALGIPKTVSVVAVMPLGYADENPAARPRKPLSEIVSYDRY